MTSQDTYIQMREDEASARLRRIKELEAKIRELNDELRRLKEKPAPIHPGQLQIHFGGGDA